MNSHREACKRQHRVLGHFLAIQAWLRGLDCIVLEREHLEEFLGLERFKGTRVEWLQEDLKPWFAEQTTYFNSKSESSLHSLFLSRVSMTGWLSSDSMTTEKRISQLPERAPKTALFSSKVKGKHSSFKEVDIVRYLAILDSGLLSPQDLSSLPATKP